MRFFVGVNPRHASRFERAFLSVVSLRDRRSDFPANDWIMDSGAFSTIAKHGGYPQPPSEYAAQIMRWQRCGNLLAAVSQDYMCEDWMLAKTGLSIADHQRLTIERYDALVAEVEGTYVMPVLQGYSSRDYIEHLRAYGDRLAEGAWVGVGSVCKRNSDPGAVWKVLDWIHDERPDLRLHGFGVKTTTLAVPFIRELLHSSDSMAWSFAARRQGRDQHDPEEARAFVARIEEFDRAPQGRLFRTAGAFA